MDNVFDDSKLMNFVNAFGSGLSSWRWGVFVIAEQKIVCA